MDIQTNSVGWTNTTDTISYRCSRSIHTMQAYIVPVIDLSRKQVSTKGALRCR